MANDRALKVLDRFASEGRTAFSAAEVRAALGTSPQATSNLLARWASMGLVDRLAVGRYAVRQIGSLGTAAVWDDLGSAVAAVFAGHPHRIGFLTALDHHGLLVRPVRAIQVASPYRPREKALTGRPLRVIREREDTVLIGTEPLGPSRVATVPRALLDAASRPLLVEARRESPRRSRRQTPSWESAILPVRSTPMPPTAGLGPSRPRCRSPRPRGWNCPSGAP